MSNTSSKQTGARTAVRKHKFELHPDGSVERVGPFGSYGPTVEARNKSEAIVQFLKGAYRMLENTPRLKIRNGAYQLAYEGLNYTNVESGTFQRQCLCFTTVADQSLLTDDNASFAYYASEQFQNCLV